MIKFDVRMSRWPFPVALALALGQVTSLRGIDFITI